MIESVIVVRHSEREDTVDESWVYSSATPYDTPLSIHGEQQAAATAAAISGTTIYCSPFLRCLQTALPIAAALDAKIKITSAFGEWMTPDYFENGAPPPDNHASLVATAYNWALRHRGIVDASDHIDFSWNAASLGDSGVYGEEWREMHERALSGLDAILARGHGTGETGIVVIVTHGGLCNSLLGRLHGKPLVRKVDVSSWEAVNVEHGVPEEDPQL